MPGMKRWVRPLTEGPQGSWHWTSGPTLSTQGRLLVACGRAFLDPAYDVYRADSWDVPAADRCSACEVIYERVHAPAVVG